MFDYIKFTFLYETINGQRAKYFFPRFINTLQKPSGIKCINHPFVTTVGKIVNVPC